MGVHTGATWRIRLNRPCAAAMRSFCQITLTTCLQKKEWKWTISWIVTGFCLLLPRIHCIYDLITAASELLIYSAPAAAWALWRHWSVWRRRSVAPPIDSDLTTFQWANKDLRIIQQHGMITMDYSWVHKWTWVHTTFLIILNKLECGPMPNVMVTLPNIGGALRSTP